MYKNQEFEWMYSSVTRQSPRDGIEIYDLVRTSFKPGCHIKRISKREYMTGFYNAHGDFISDGEVYEIRNKEEPMRNRRSLRQIFRTLRQLIATNFKGGNSELFLTLTYAKQHNNPDQMHEDLKKFWLRFKYRYPDTKYIAIVEPHATGMFHVHFLVADTTGADLYIHYTEAEELWGHGNVKVERLNDIDHMGAYFIAYFSNLELTPEEVTVYEAESDVEYKNGKAYIKGRRLDFYPEHMRIYRHSRNCDKPIKVTGFEADLELMGSELVYEHDTTFTDDGNEYTIRTAQYKKKGIPY